MELLELMAELAEHNRSERGYQIHLNSGNLDDKSDKHTDVEFGDLYFTECSTLKDTTLLCFGNMNRKPVSKKDDGTELYPMEINNNLFIDISKIEAIEDVKDFEDWFMIPSIKVVNIYMLPENDTMTGKRNVVTVGFIK